VFLSQPLSVPMLYVIRMGCIPYFNMCFHVLQVIICKVGLIYKIMVDESGKKGI